MGLEIPEITLDDYPLKEFSLQQKQAFKECTAFLSLLLINAMEEACKGKFDDRYRVLEWMQRLAPSLYKLAPLGQRLLFVSEQIRHRSSQKAQGLLL